MKKIDGKTYYTWSDYAKDMRATDWIKCDHVVAVYRGSLGMASHVSNIKDIPMSIVGFQTRDGDDKKPYWIHNATEADKSWLDDSDGKHILVVDDIYDTGRTMNKVQEFIKSKQDYLPMLEDSINEWSKSNETSTNVDGDASNRGLSDYAIG